MLIVIGIILILITMGVMGFRSMETSAAKKQTVTTLATGDSLVRELNAIGALNRLQGPSTLLPKPIFVDGAGPISSPGDVNQGQGGRNTAILAQQAVMLVLLSSPKN